MYENRRRVGIYAWRFVVELIAHAHRLAWCLAGPTVHTNILNSMLVSDCERSEPTKQNNGTKKVDARN